MISSFADAHRRTFVFSFPQALPDNTIKNIPGSMLTDQYGIVGLFAFIKAAETDPTLVHLALGNDLTTLGLNLNSPE